MFFLKGVQSFGAALTGPAGGNSKDIFPEFGIKSKKIR